MGITTVGPIRGGVGKVASTNPPGKWHFVGIHHVVGLERLLKGSKRAEVRWHTWRWEGATYLQAFGLPWRFLCWWGRWDSVKMAHYYATPPDEFELVESARLPWPTETSFRWKPTHMALLWPKSVTQFQSHGQMRRSKDNLQYETPWTRT